MQQPRLVIYPQSSPPESVEYTSLLKQLELISDGFEFKTQKHYLVGQQFFQHIMFLGCSPFIKTELSDNIDDINFCHIELVSSSEPQFFHSHHVRTPRCPQCKQDITNWQMAITQWQQDKTQTLYTCSHCQHTISIMELNWHKKAGFAYEMLNIWGIFEGEAIPSDNFLSQLKKQTDVNWYYCHATGNIYM